MNYTQALTMNQIQEQAPSVFADRPYAGQSSRYTFIPTSRIIEGMANSGFVPVAVQQSRSRIEAKSGYTKHMVRFRAINDIAAQAIVGNSIVEAVLVNSHDGSSTYNLFLGLFRFTCANGAMVADGTVESLKFRHTGRIIREVIAGTKRIFSQAPKVLDVVGRWSDIQLAQPERLALAEAAHSVRFPVNEEGKANTDVTPAMLLESRRWEDDGNDLWKTFNVLQENTIRGIRKGARGNRITSREISGIGQNVSLNKALWSLAEKMEAIKTAA